MIRRMTPVAVGTLVVALLLLAARAFAQDAPTSYELRIYQGGTAPVSTTTFLASAVTCGLAKVTVPTTTIVNPVRVIWEDPADPTKDCIADQSTYLLARPVGTYTASLVAVNEAGASAESARSNPFARSLPPDSPRAVRIAR